MELLIGIVVLGFVVFLVDRYEKQRREKISSAGRSSGWIPSDGLPRDVAASLTDSVLYPSRSRNQSLPIVFSIPRVGGAECFFECRYVIGSGKNRSTYKHLCLFVPSTESLPQFELRGERWFDRIAASVGFDDINLPNFPEFSKKFHLSGSSADEIQRLFTAELIAKVPPLGRSKITTVSGGVLVRKEESKLTPEMVRQQYDELAALAQIFAR